jgi:hypothetical protein
MNHLLVLFSGIIIGVYIDQNYKVPNVSSYVKKIKETLKSHEK